MERVVLKRTKEFLGVTNVLNLGSGGGGCVSVNIKWMHLIVCKLYLNKADS